MVLPGSATYFVEVSAHVCLKVATKGYFRGKKTLKIQIFKLFFYRKNGGMQPKKLKFLW